MSVCGEDVMWEGMGEGWGGGYARMENTGQGEAFSAVPK